MGILSDLDLFVAAEWLLDARTGEVASIGTWFANEVLLPDAQLLNQDCISPATVHAIPKSGISSLPRSLTKKLGMILEPMRLKIPL
jgi:hypothetical protein